MYVSCLEDPPRLVIIDTLQIVNYVTNPIQFQGDFLHLYYEKI